MRYRVAARENFRAKVLDFPSGAATLPEPTTRLDRLRWKGQKVDPSVRNLPNHTAPPRGEELEVGIDSPMECAEDPHGNPHEYPRK